MSFLSCRERISCLALFLAAITLPVTAQPTVSKSSIPSGQSSQAQVLHGTVLQVEGNNLAVKMDSGDIRNITTSPGQQVMINGQPVAVKDVKVGTKLTATVMTTTTTITERTTTVGSGKVWFVSGNNVILRLPNGENHQYFVKDDYKFTVNGKPASVYELRKGMTVSAVKIVEEPKTFVSSNTTVTGELPIELASAPQAAPVPARQQPKPTPASAPVAKAEPSPAPAKVAPAPAAPARLPKTASSLPLIGLAGLLLTGGSVVSMALRHRK